MDRLGDKKFLILGKINNFCVRMASLAITGLGRNEIYLWLCRCKYDSISCLYIFQSHSTIVLVLLVIILEWIMMQRHLLVVLRTRYIYRAWPRYRERLV